ncbi:MAG: hypothetical protein FWH38_07800 [Treponema sp.]|nr:hypothetical protein [Treponema sp.]
MIGTRHETSLHRELKFSYAGQGGRTEAEVAGFVADGISASGEFIEVQTGSFKPLRQKAGELASRGRLRIVYPVVVAKYIEVFDSGGKRQYRRKSPRRGSAWDLFDALVYAPDLPLTRGLTVELALVDAVERRVKDGKGSWRRRGISIQDRSLLAFHESVVLKKPSDYLRFAPFKKKEQFTSSLLSERAGIPVDLARKTLYVLSRIGVVKKKGKKGNSILYYISV